MSQWITRVRTFLTQEDGQDLIEYALLAALIALAAVVAMTATGTSISNLFANVAGIIGANAGA